jgi:HEAT repeat protein
MAETKTSLLLRKICSLLKSSTTEYQCAACMVLGELGSKDRLVIKSLGEILNSTDDTGLKGLILEAFEKINSKESLKYLLSFLFNRTALDGDFGNKAIAIVSSLSTETSRELKALLKKASTDEKKVITSIFIRMRHLEGLKVVLESLFDGNESLVSDICRQMKQEMKGLNSRQRKSFSAHVEKFLVSPRTRKNLAATAAAIKILGYIADANALDSLLMFTSLQNHPSIRHFALSSLREIPFTDKIKNDVIRKLVSYLNEKDFNGIVSPTLDILSRAPIHSSLSDLVVKLLDSSHDAVKRFALRKMREFNTVKVVKILVEKISDSDPRIRDLAAESLCWLDSARNILLDSLLKENNPERARFLSRILRPHSTKFRKDQVNRVGDALKKHLKTGSPLQESMIYLLKIRSPDFLHEIILGRAVEFKKRKKYTEAVQALQLLQRSEHFNVDGQYVLGVCLLKMSKRNLNKATRESDPCLDVFRKLLGSDGFPLVSKIKADSALAAEDIYYLGHHFSEKMQQERLFGGELLRFLSKKRSSTKVIKASREKIQSEGL